MNNLVGFCRTCSFRVNLKTKPNRYGIKVWMLRDVETSYAWNFQVYLGKTGSQREAKQGKHVFLDLVHGLGQGHKITTDTFFYIVSPYLLYWASV
ncbi:hypothetical protein T10_12983 [Trichinella papuae]|uniref:PiggyBac transposable element-derived protein domain-containing protein n=1 Tax=Trichinella papuae TaxID=268474 RepID=A0A0V1MN74_9BILA|nr:hypothetical protein T10_12983 [Trichinella papuae]